jgi:hypothetical protein
VFLDNSIVSDNIGTATPDVDGPFTAGFSLIENATGSTLTVSPAGSALTGLDPQLGALTNGPGPTDTRVPAATSPVVDCGFSLETADQRGEARPVDIPGRTNSTAAGANGSDMGSVELQAGAESAGATGACANLAPPVVTPVTPAPPVKKKKKCKKKKIAPGKKKKCKKKKKK